jgi:hypothetical protein
MIGATVTSKKATTAKKHGRCAKTLSNGRPCGGYAITGSPYCFRHSPETAAARYEASSRGGKVRQGRTVGVVRGAQLVEVQDYKSLLQILANELGSTLGLERSNSRARTVAALALAAARVLDSLRESENERRLAAIEARLNEAQSYVTVAKKTE